MIKQVLVVAPSADLAGVIGFSLKERWPEITVEHYDPERSLPPAHFDWDKYQLVVLEAELGRSDESGLDWILGLRQQLRVPPILFLTSHGEDETAARALQLGATSYLNKRNASADRIVECVIEMLGAPAARVERAYEKTLVQGLAPPAPAATTSASSGSIRSGTQSRSRTSPGGIFRDVQIPGYRMLTKIAEGGMASVRVAERLGDRLNVVLKILHLGGSHDGELVTRFMHEFDLIMHLDHPNVVRVYERGFGPDFAYIAMEYLPGGDLRARMADGLAPESCLQITRQIAAGLGAIHEIGVVHRDIKPGNVLIKDDQQMVISDFGVAKDLIGEHKVTTPGAVVGTPLYISPEQVTGSDVDLRSDLYSLGVILYEMLTGKRPFHGRTAEELMRARLSEPVPRLPGNLKRLQPIIDGLLAKDPDDRFQNVKELLMGLDWP